MAKKKKSAAESRGNGAVAKKRVKIPKPPVQPPSLTNDSIGDTAGKVWHALADKPLTVSALKKSVGAPDEVVLAALGWLAREGKLAFETNGRSVTVSLR
jgi:hypothetical protein